MLLAAGWILAALAASYVLIAHRAHAKFADRHGTSKHKPALPLYTADDANACVEQFRPIAMEHRTALAGDVSFTLRRSGHLLGACFVRFDSPALSITFTGDLGRQDDPILKAPAVPHTTDYSYASRHTAIVRIRTSTPSESCRNDCSPRSRAVLSR